MIVLGPWRCTAAQIEQSTLGRGALGGNLTQVSKMMVDMFLLPVLPVLTRAHTAPTDRTVRRSVAIWPVLSKCLTGFSAASETSSME